MSWTHFTIWSARTKCQLSCSFRWSLVAFCLGLDNIYNTSLWGDAWFISDLIVIMSYVNKSYVCEIPLLYWQRCSASFIGQPHFDLVNMIEIKLLSESSSNLADMLTMMRGRTLLIWKWKFHIRSQYVNRDTRMLSIMWESTLLISEVKRQGHNR